MFIAILVITAVAGGFMLARHLRYQRFAPQLEVPTPGVVPIGEHRPDFALPDLAGTVVPLSRFDGRPILLNSGPAGDHPAPKARCRCSMPSRVRTRTGR
ncbi:MAG: hypothetical protein IPH50_14070 [Rhodanobacteraceae bacterium]|nr:hypothetical protein [Rhodanobacteraceae bacterium]